MTGLHGVTGPRGVRPLPVERLRLIVLTDTGAAHPRSVPHVVRAALEAGAPAIQLREKERGAGEAVELARELRDLTRAYAALFFLNDRVDLALAVGADGVHLGPDDLPVSEVRRVVPGDFLIGFSTDDPMEAATAERAGADYLGVGAIWATPSKTNAGEAIGPAGVARVSAAVSIPVVAIGGVTVERAALLTGTGAAGIAVIGAVMGAADPGAAVRNLLDAFRGPRSSSGTPTR